ncbi:hypothetical protein IV203_029322 [Nitzschia inconspicua]|uniref:Sulfotransferase domain-containing protein n=1 Tax=Nitzschia inconspicua TaxID=303405 RepID=A0A9K3LQZ0_9STRA|nr:hypothetical protein IV203_029322 [Nitzschia inconspicua]
MQCRVRRWFVLTTLFLTFVGVNLMTLLYWHSNFGSPSAAHTKKEAVSIGDEKIMDHVNTTIHPYHGPHPTTMRPMQQQQQQQSNDTRRRHPSQRQDRMDTLDRLKHVLKINNTVQLLQKIKSRGDNIPLWSDIERLYGNSFPQVIGLDQCQQYKATVPQSQRWIAPAGLFHTGTNLLASLMTNSCAGIPFQGQVPYGKHNPLFEAMKANYRVPSKSSYQSVADFSQILPVVMVRHPLDWIKSMCHQKYAVSWKNTTDKLPCPSLSTPISVNFFQPVEYHHLMELWQQWNQQYLDYDRPTLVIRLEDLVYAPQETLQTVCECVGGTFHYNPELLEQRKGGVERQDDKNNVSIKAWARHSHVTIDGALSSSKENQRLFREIVKDTKVQKLLDTFQYSVV